MKGPFGIIGLAALIVSVVAYFIGGYTLVEDGLIVSWNTMLQAIPLILTAFLVIGQLQQLISAESIKNSLENLTGLKGIILASLAGGLFPGPPYVYYPFLASFKEKKIPFYLFFTFIVGKQSYDFARIPMEVSLINPGIALFRNLITAPVPIIMGLLSKYFYPEVFTDEYFENYEGATKEEDR